MHVIKVPEKSAKKIAREAFRVKIQEVFSILPENTGITGGFSLKYRTIFKALKIQAEIVILQEIQELQESVPRLYITTW